MTNKYSLMTGTGVNILQHSWCGEKTLVHHLCVPAKRVATARLPLVAGPGLGGPNEWIKYLLSFSQQ